MRSVESADKSFAAERVKSMTTLVVTAAKKNFSVIINGKKEQVHHLKFVCYNNSLCGSVSWDGLTQERAEAKVAQANRNYAKLESKPKLFVSMESDATAEHRLHKVVYKATDDFKGTTTDDNLENLEELGILIKSGNKWLVETSLEKVETLRREAEINGLRQGKRFIGFEGAVHGVNAKNAELYASLLKEKDAENGGKMVTRGWYLD